MLCYGLTGGPLFSTHRGPSRLSFWWNVLLSMDMTLLQGLRLHALAKRRLFAAYKAVSRGFVLGFL
jgi:hypothetical protein